MFVYLSVTGEFPETDKGIKLHLRYTPIVSTQKYVSLNFAVKIWCA